MIRALGLQDTVGFIGLGIMGKPMAHNLLKAGFRLLVRDRNSEPVQELVRLGAQDGGTPQEIAAQADAIITCLPDSPDVRAVMEGSEGILAGLGPGKVVIDMSTISPVVARELELKVRELGAAMLDAPVSGGQVGAQQRTLSIMVGGEPAVFDAALPLFQALGKNIVRIGGPGAGQVTKACNQIVVALTIEAISEALLLAVKAGVDPTQVRAALLGGFAQSRILELHGQRILDRNFQPGFRNRLHFKDLRIALDAGRAYGAILPTTSLVNELFGSLIATGKGELDHSSLVTVLEQLSRGEVSSLSSEAK